MKLYFSSKQFEQLEGFSFNEKQQIIALATSKMSPGAKVFLNLLKLCILTPPFLMLANIDSWWFLMPLVFVLIGYFIVLRPISLYFIKKHLSQAINEFVKTNE
ncbi:DUF6170 family protein [Thalassomonas sp. M1454]|uniref:DUF6170 family protein n=1 Tax=Thalassomonas sp. M1454 TaxID=2594477 RepID=UPI00117DC836|nr:DUF6170 family protein [Thalassomonas sp. M1454]TRX57422.1 hypothetical protein FNN08_07970 [Thalassomonas sp. M1454]